MESCNAFYGKEHNATTDVISNSSVSLLQLHDSLGDRSGVIGLIDIE